MNAWFTRMARALNRRAGRSGPVFEDRYDSRVLRSPTEVRRARAYVEGNAEHHFGRTEGDPFIFVVRVHGEMPTTEARLARVGWKGVSPVGPPRGWLMRHHDTG